MSLRIIWRYVPLSLALALAVNPGWAQQKGKDGPKKKDAPAKTAAKGDAAAGKDLYKSNCAVCHFADSTDKRIGPGMKGLFKREKLFDDRPVNEENVRSIIMKGTTKMIPFEEKLDKKQIDDVIAYLKTL